MRQGIYQRHFDNMPFFNGKIMFRLAAIIKLFSAVVFIISAIMKLVSMDAFELYLYSFGIFSLDFTMIAARLLIAAELFLGSLLLLGIYSKFAVNTSIIMLFGFTGFITYLLIVNNHEHCHCFGDLVVLSHPLSIIKNLLLVGMLVIARKTSDWIIRFRTVILATLLITSIALVFIISPPDCLRRDYYKSKTTYNEQKLNEFIQDQNLQDKKKVAFFFGASCHYCKLTAQKLAVFLDKAHNENNFMIVFMGDNETANQKFLQEYKLEKVNYTYLNPMDFLKITNGSLPLVFILDKGEVVETYGYRSLREKSVLDFVAQ